MLEDLASTRELSWDDFESARQNINPSLPKGHRLPYLERPNTDSKAKASININLGAAEVMHFALNRYTTCLAYICMYVCMYVCM